jgi:hypothetical protein
MSTIPSYESVGALWKFNDGSNIRPRRKGTVLEISHRAGFEGMKLSDQKSTFLAQK